MKEPESSAPVSASTERVVPASMFIPISKLKESTGRSFDMPILHLSQLVGVAAGLAESELKFKRHVVSVAPIVEQLEV